MFLKKYAKLMLITLVFSFCLVVCSCAAVTTLPRDIERINSFKDEVIAITELKDQEEIVTRLEALIHPASGLTKETVIEKAQASPALQGLDVVALAQQGYSIGSFSDYDFRLSDPELGGNIYSLSVQITLGGEKFVVHLDMLSDDTTLGLYDFEITR